MLEKNKIYCMDCLEGLKQLEDDSVDCIITDPPYNIDLKPQRGLTDAIENDSFSKEIEFSAWFVPIIKELDRVLKPDSFVIMFTGWSTIPLFRSILDSYWDLKSMPVWIKNNFGIGYYTRPQYEPCFLYFKGKPAVLNKAISDVWIFNKVLVPVHSCEKPLDLMKFIVNSFTSKGQTVIDPFSGVGNSLVACKYLERSFIGFELNKDYVEEASKRLKNIQDNRLDKYTEESK